MSSVNRRVLMADQQASDTPTRPEYLPEPETRATETSSDLLAMVTKHHPGDV